MALHSISPRGLRRIEHVDLEWWQAYDRAYPAPTFFARPAWSLALGRAYPFLTPMPVLVRLRGGRRIFVPLVMRRGRIIPFRMLSGLPLGTYTMALAEDGREVSIEEATETFDLLSASTDALSVNYWPLAFWPVAPSIESLQASARMYETSIIDVSEGAEAALERMDGRALRNARAAVRRGVVCEHDASSGHADRYFNLLCIAARAWESEKPSITRELVQAVVDAGGDDAEVWFAYHESEIVAGGLILYGAKEAFFWSAAMRPEAGALRPSNALNVALIRRAAERGLSWFNMGASDGLPGVSRFKKSLGALLHDYRTYSIQSPAYENYHRIRTFLTRQSTS